ncbi:polysaccharide lyase family protein [Evansella sp. AB-P1]|uniref:polysaccharide lyase family protein n=1 Tax=Evansella sp. AB-P1 TaxID=3037653 RepID=UPI00241F7C0E|nr:polysaccharide lyase family protein [Evansella sp. AB-P1]MDG5790101.1 polysaccharide lyase family protein [Evansella sp. AB-P1]
MGSKKFTKVVLALILALSTFNLAVFSNDEVNSEDSSLEELTYLFDFGPGPTEEGYIGVSCNELYSPSKGYGLLSSVDGRDRSGQFNNMKRDFCVGGSSIGFQVDLPNGLYNVNIIMGDQIASQSSTTVTAQGEVVLEGVSASSGEFIEETFEVEVTDGQFNVQLNGNTVRLNGLEIEPIWKFDFGSGDVESGFIGVTCEDLYDDEVGYGWTDITGIEAVNQGISSALLNDYCSGNTFGFQVDLPNSYYNVKIISGDESNETTTTVFVEGEEVVNISEEAGSYSEDSFDITVDNGHLNMEFMGDPARVNGIIITLTTPEEEEIRVEAPSYKFDFGTGPTEEGYIGLSCNEIYDPSVGYGFLSSVDGRDRSQQLNALRRDFCVAGSSLSFQANVPNGWYNVSLIMGDEIASQSSTTVRIQEEVVLEGASASAGNYIDESFYVKVEDGQLLLQLNGNTVRLNALHIQPVWKFDFGPGPVESGFEGIMCNELYSSETGYGWTDVSGIGGVNQETTDVLLSNYCYGESMNFQVNVPNSLYTVTVMSGDANEDTATTVKANGEEIVTLTEETGVYSEESFDVNVEEEQLNIEFSGSPARINALIIESKVEIEEIEWRVDEGVELVDLGSSVMLTNSEISFTLTKGNGRIPSLRKRGDFQDTNLLGGQGGYYHLNYVLDGNRRTYGGSGMSYRLVSQTDDRIEVAVSTTNPERLPFELEYRYVLEADSPGVYVYSIFKYPEHMPDGMEVEQSRYSFRANPTLFNQYGIEDDHKGDRLGEFPRPQDISAGQTLMDATTRLPNGEIYTKYNHAVHIGDNRVNGIFGENLGISVIRTSDEYLVGGPSKQEYYIEQTTSTPMVHWYEQVRHFGVPNVVPEKGWEKIYGPFFVYVNEGDGVDELWNDVKDRTDQEQEKWPYAWLDDPLYQADTRGEVTGNLNITDGSSPEDAWVILGEQDINFYEQNLDYLYYTRADSDGNFHIPHVRAGEYTLFAYVDGVFGEFHYDGVNVSENQLTDLEQLDWTPTSHGEKLWQIGTPDRTPREFYYGDELRQWGLWLQYPFDFPDDVDFVIGESDESTDWNYFHPNIKTPGNENDLLVPRDTTLAEWLIRFDTEDVDFGEGTLTIGIAASSRGTLNVNLNGTDIFTSDGFVTPLEQDASLYRSGESGYYYLLEIPFDASLLQEGENIIALKHAELLSGSHVGIMYDALKMEILTVPVMKQLVKDYAATGDIQMPLLPMLQNRLNQVEHHLNHERLEEAIKHLEDFIKHLNQRSLQDHVSGEAMNDLNYKANLLIDRLSTVE